MSEGSTSGRAPSRAVRLLGSTVVLLDGRRGIPRHRTDARRPEHPSGELAQVAVGRLAHRSTSSMARESNLVASTCARALLGLTGDEVLGGGRSTSPPGRGAWR